MEQVIDGETLPLFHQPGKQGYYAPVLGSGSVTRLNAFRNVGRQVTGSNVTGAKYTD